MPDKYEELTDGPLDKFVERLADQLEREAAVMVQREIRSALHYTAKAVRDTWDKMKQEALADC